MTTKHDGDRFFERRALSSGLGRRAIRGVAVTLGAEWGRFAVRMGSTVVLARLLTPDDYGLIGMVTAVTGAAFLLQDLGLSHATIQRERLTHAQVTALFWVNVAVGLLLCLGLSLAAPSIAAFYGRPELTGITIALSTTFVLGSLSVQHQALLSRRMRFGRLSSIEVTAAAFGAVVAVLAAWRGSAYWALVLMQVSGAAATAVMVWLSSGWRPGLPRRTAGVGQMLTFGGNLSVFKLLNYLSRNADNVLIGRFAGAQALGLYSRAYQLLLMPIHEVNRPLSKVALPTLSLLQSQPTRYRRYYRTAISGIAYSTMPVIALIAALANEVILILLGGQWVEAAPIFRVLAFAGMAQSVAHANGWLYVSTGRTGRQAVWALISRPLIVLSFVLGLPWGAFGVAVAYTVCQYVLLVPGFAIATRGSPVSMRDILDAGWRPFAVSLIAYGCAVAAHDRVSGSVPLIAMASTGAAWLAVLVVAWFLWPRLRRDLLETVAFVRKGLGQPRQSGSAATSASL